MLLLGLGAIIWQNADGEPLQAAPGDRAWVNVHIATAVVTYGLVTIAAVAAFAAFLQERTLKRKRPTRADPAPAVDRRLRSSAS